MTGRKYPVCVVCSLLTHLSRAKFMTDPAQPWDERREKRNHPCCPRLPDAQLFWPGAPGTSQRTHPPLPGDQIDVVS